MDAGDRLRRQPIDAVRLGCAVAVVTLAAVLAHMAEPSLFEVDAFRLVNDLPAGAGAPLLGFMQLGALAAVPVFAAVALLGHGGRLARLLLIGGGLSWLAAKALQTIVDQEPPDVVLSRVSLHGITQAGLAFPATHVAVAAALATVAAPYLSRPSRRFAWWSVVLVGVARVYIGAHFPLDAIGGAAVGWGVGSLLLLVFGSPRGTPSTAHVARVMADHGHRVRGVELVDPSAGAATYRVLLEDGTTMCAKVLGRDQPESDWLYRAARALVFRQLPITYGGDPARRAEHEAFLLLVGERQGLPVPALVGSYRISGGEVLLATRHVSGRSLAELGASGLDDAVLGRTWDALASVHAARMALGPVDLDDLVVDDAGRVWFVDLSRGRHDATGDDLARDRAELLARLCPLVGATRAVGSAAASTTGEELGRTLSFLLPLELSTAARRMVAGHGRLDELRRATAAAAGVDAAPADPPVRIAVRNLVPLAAGLFAVNLLLPQVSQAPATWAVLRRASWPWLGVTVAIGALTYLMAAVALLGASDRRLSLGRTWLVQLSAAFTNRLAPAGLGGMQTNVRYLEESGSTRSAAMASVGLTSASGFVVHVVGLALVVPLLGAGRAHLRSSGPELPDAWPFFVVAVGILAVIGAIRWRVHLGRRLLPTVRAAQTSVVGVVKEPLRALELFGGSAGLTAAYALALAAAGRAVSLGVPLATVVAVYLAGSAVAAAAPTPGGLGSMEIALVAGLTSAGAASAPAVATVLAYRLITYWLPLLPGTVVYFALRRERARAAGSAPLTGRLRTP